MLHMNMFLSMVRKQYKQWQSEVAKNPNRRKHKKRIDMEKVELIAPEDAPVLYNSRNLPMEDYSSRMSGDKHYIAVVLGDKGKERIRFTPDEKMLELMKLKGRSKVQEA